MLWKSMNRLVVALMATLFLSACSVSDSVGVQEASTPEKNTGNISARATSGDWGSYEGSGRLKVFRNSALNEYSDWYVEKGEYFRIDYDRGRSYQITYNTLNGKRTAYVDKTKVSRYWGSLDWARPNFTLNVRNQPSESAEVIGTVYPWEDVCVLGYAGPYDWIHAWAHIQYVTRNGIKSGYVSNNLSIQ